MVKSNFKSKSTTYLIHEMKKSKGFGNDIIHFIDSMGLNYLKWFYHQKSMKRLMLQIGLQYLRNGWFGGYIT